MAFHTLGCKVNQSDTAGLAGAFLAAGYQIVPFDQPADVYVVNTCTVTNTGAKKSRQTLRQAVERARQAGRDGVVAAVGCYAQVAPEQVAAIPGVDVVVGTRERHRLVELVERALRDRALPAGNPLVAVVPHPPGEAFEAPAVAPWHGRARATLKIQEGCQQHCTYCQVPLARGPERSLPPERVQEAVRDLWDRGYREIVLVGIHLGAYGRDLGGDLDLAGLLAQLAAMDGPGRFRLGSVEPHDVTAALVDVLADNPGRICPHVHLPLQSGDDETLRRMARRYRTADYARRVDALRRKLPDVAISTDLIVGFPGESEERFRQSLRFVEEMEFSRIHAFPYSPRSGTAAARFPQQVPSAEKHRRLKEVEALAHSAAESYARRFLGRELEVLLETAGPASDPPVFRGTSAHYLTVDVELPPQSPAAFKGLAQPGTLVRALAEAIQGRDTEGWPLLRAKWAGAGRN